MNYVYKLLLVTFITLFVFACSDEHPMEIKVTDHTSTECTNPRPEMCTMDYRPVCATKDTGIRCITEPCGSTATATYSNGCSACSDPTVLSYVPEECKE
jgi:hypothetical protein